MTTSQPDPITEAETEVEMEVEMESKQHTDWVAWHGAYDDPGSSLSRRRVVVERCLAEALIAAPGALVLSLCAGDGRDVINVLRSGEVPVPSKVVLVEIDPTLAQRAARAAADLNPIEVRCADASDPAVFADVVPADVLLFCGVLGNIDHRTIDTVIGRCAGLVRPGGRVIWTRGGGEPDRRDEVRQSFARAGLVEEQFIGAPELFGVGAHRRPLDAVPAPATAPLFEFVR